MKVGIRYWMRENRVLLFFCVTAVLAGIIIGFIAISDPLLHHWRISQNLIDRNIINSINPERGIFNFFFGRFFDIFLKGLLIFLVALTPFTRWIVFPLLALRGYWVVVNMFWIVSRFGISGIVLAIVYFFILMIVLSLLVVFAIYLIKLAKQVRLYGLRSCDHRAFKTTMMFAFVVFVLSFFEWMLYFLILSRMVFPQG